MDKAELTGSEFSLDQYLNARKKVINAVHEISSNIKIGMTEMDGHDLIEKTLKSYGAIKKWHPSKFRIGINTLKSFKEPSDPNIILKENDIFFIDIGPVFDNHEADYGETFVLGNDPEQVKIKQDVKIIFEQVKKHWQINNLSGRELYDYLNKIVQAFNYELNFNMKGHRLGDFPHALYHRDSLMNFERKPIENLWILEVLIRHKEKSFGAFYEDILKF